MRSPFISLCLSRPLLPSLLCKAREQGRVTGALGLGKEEHVEREVDHGRAVRFGVLLVGGFGHADAVLDRREAGTVCRATAFGLRAFLVRPFERHGPPW